MLRISSVEEETSADHFVSVFGLLALVDRVVDLLRNLFLKIIFVVETNGLRAGHWLFVFSLQVVTHAHVLITVGTHLFPAGVFFGSAGLFVNRLFDFAEAGLELLPGHLAIVVGVEIIHEHLNFFFEGREPVSVVEHVFHFVDGDSA